MTNILTILSLGLMLSAPLHGQTLNTIYSFGHNDRGYQPAGGLAIGANGQLYGTTLRGGGLSNFGVIYELVPPASPGGGWTEKVLHSFNTQDGPAPFGVGLALGPSGVVYGVTGFNNVDGDGTVFQLKAPAQPGAHWREAVLHSFSGTDGDGAGPGVTPLFGAGKVLFGTTTGGGAMGGGTVYGLAPPGAPGGAWTEQVLYSFAGFRGDGIEPFGPLALDSGGVIYGSTIAGGAYSTGTVYQVAPPALRGAFGLKEYCIAFPAAKAVVTITGCQTACC